MRASLGDFTPGRTVGTYRLERLLGRGGMGAVFLAYDTRLHRHVALKVINSELEDATSSARLLREARNAAALNHPHICTIHEVGEEGSATFIAMEYVAGRSLRDRIDEGAMPSAEVVSLGVQAADALGYAHEHGVVHRDFKAANVIVSDNGRLKVVDFGLARREDALLAEGTTMASLVPAGVLAGTPYSMAPEQVRGETTDARTDVWALGVLLYEMATTAKPFRGQTVPDLYSSILTKPAATLPSTVPTPLRAAIEQCLEKDPARRYQRAGDLRAALEAIAAGTVAPWVASSYHMRRRPVLITAAAFAVAVGVLLGFNVGRSRDRLLGLPDQAPIKLAVLPFQNLTGDRDQEYFSDGLTDEMITQLGRLHPQRLSVIARTSSMRYKSRDAPIDQIGRELGVDYVLEGSARREGARVRINATLIQVRNQTQRWTSSFEREVAGILALQNDVARGIAQSLALTLLPDEQRRLARTPSVNPEAYEAYLKGLNLEANPTPANLTNAMSYFELARTKDADYAPAYAGIGGIWFVRQLTGIAPRSEATPKLEAALHKALQLDDGLADVHFRLGQHYAMDECNWTAADLEFRRAIDLNPNQAATRSVYADYLAIVRRPDDAVAQIQRALELDPVSSLTQAFYARVLMFVGRHEQAIAQYRATLKTTPEQQVAIANIREPLHIMGRFDEAFAADQIWAKSNRRAGAEIADALARGFKEGGYRGAMHRTAEALAAQSAAPFIVAQFYVRAGETDRALAALEEASRENPCLPYLNVGPIWNSLRSNARFQALLRRMNLPM
jgi:serine/threonine protein kinase/tetratricopeptide (TPR) repeat protein